MVNVFNVQIFFIVFRETLEAVIVVSVLLAFLKQGLGKSTDDPKVYKKLKRQIWFGAILGVVICLIIGCAFIGAFYGLGKDIWGQSEDLWEGIFCIIATVLISLMGIPMLRINKMKEKWRVKLAQALVKQPKPEDGRKVSIWERLRLNNFIQRYALFILPVITCLREGLEAVVFVGGVGLDKPHSSYRWFDCWCCRWYLVVLLRIQLVNANLFDHFYWYFVFDCCWFILKRYLVFRNLQV